MADLQQSISNQTHFSTTLSTHLLSQEHNSNVVFSPLSIHAALSVLAAGSKGQTLDQLLGFLKTNSNNDLNSLYSHHVSSVLADVGPSDGPRVSFANGVWVDKTLSFKPGFKHVVDTVYKAECNQVDFYTKANEVAEEVNLWAEKQTNGLIREVIPPDEISHLTRLIFANAVYFKGTWRYTFEPLDTFESNFYLLGGSEVRVPFMTSSLDQFVREYDDFKVLGLPYLKGQEKRQFTMYFFLPNAKDGLQSLVKKMGSTSDFLDCHIPRKRVEIKRFKLPKFRIEFGFKVCDMLRKLGVVLPFSGEGLSEIADSSVGERLHVSSIRHKSFIEVNEEGTEAAAVTTVEEIDGCCLAEEKPKVDFVADHPFLFVLREDVTGAVLFMGQVNDPSVGWDSS